MNFEKEVAKIQGLCKPLTNIPIVKAMWIYGSAIKKKQFEKGHDIDIMVVTDDTREAKEDELDKIKRLISLIEEKANNKKIILHFQPLKTLTLWWDLIRKGEPWAITSLREIKIIHDPSGYILLMSKLLKKGELYSTDEKAEKLLERARNKFLDIREIMLERIPFEMLSISTEASQSVLIYLGEFPVSHKNIISKLAILKKENLLEQEHIDFYEELLSMVNKIERGTLTEISGKEIDKTFEKVKRFVIKIESALLILEKREREKGVFEAYSECIKLCEQALKKKYKKLPKNDAAKIMLFKKNFIDTGKINKIHYITLIELYEYQKKKKARKELEKAKYLDKSYVKALELAIKEVK